MLDLNLEPAEALDVEIGNEVIGVDFNGLTKQALKLLHKKCWMLLAA